MRSLPDRPRRGAGISMIRLTTRLSPASLPPAIVLPITLAFAALAFMRGADWAFAREPGTVADLMLDRPMPLTFWGALLMAGATFLFLAYASRRHFPVWCSHAFLCSIYFGIAAAVLQGVIDYGGGAALLAPPIGGVIWHGVLASVMRPLPSRLGEHCAH